MKKFVGPLFALLCVSACSPPRADVEGDWGRTMNRYNFIAIFPVSEDYQPGDVVLDVPPAPNADPQPRLQRLGSFKATQLLEALKDQEKGRLFMEGDPAAASAPAAAADKGSAASTVSNITSAQPGAVITTTTSVHAAAAPQAANKQGSKPGAKPAPDPEAPVAPAVLAAESIPHGTDPAPRMHRGALPGIVAARVYDYQISGAGLFSRLAVSLGLAGEGSSTVVITLKRLEMLSFDTLAAQRILRDNIGQWLTENKMDAVTLLSETATINPDRVARICRGDVVASDRDRAEIRVINRVLYTRDIAYEYARTSTTGGRLAADISQSAFATQGSATSPAIPAQPTAASGVTAASATDAETARVLANQNRLAGSLSASGVRTTVGVGSFGGASLIDTYTRPMAVGFNAIRSFAVADSLVTIERTPAAADRQLTAARDFCTAYAPEKYLGRIFTPIERLVCANTEALRNFYHLDISMPPSCTPDGQKPPSAPSTERTPTPFRPLGPQDRDNQARS